MTHLQCSNCDYILSSDTIPDECPSCQKKCTFNDVTCYRPDCGGPGNIDEKVLGKKTNWSVNNN